MAGIEPRRGFAQRLQRLLHDLQGIGQRLKRGLDIDFIQCTPGGAALRQVVHRCSQRTRGLLESTRWFLDAAQRTGHVLAFGNRIARQFHQWPRAQAFAEELRGQFRQLMCLIDHEGLCARQDFAEAFLLEREIRQQQMMVHHHQVGGLCALARLHDETLAPERAFGAQAVVGGGRDLRQ